MSVYSRATELVDALTDAGLRATADVRNVNPPCVLIAPPRIDLSGYGTAEVTWHVFPMVPGPANLDALAMLMQMVQTIADAIPVRTAEPASYGAGSQLYPAYDCAFTETVEDDDQ